MIDWRKGSTGVVFLMLLTSCTTDTSETVEPPAGFSLEEALGLTGVADTTAADAELHESIRACMASQGFDYEIPPPIDVEVDLGDREFERGFGIVQPELDHQIEIERASDEATEFVDEAADEEGVEQPEEYWEAYWIAMDGSVSDPGCYSAALRDTGLSESLDQANLIFDNFANELAELRERVRSDDRYLEAMSEANECVTAAGFMLLSLEQLQVRYGDMIDESRESDSPIPILEAALADEMELDAAYDACGIDDVGRHQIWQDLEREYEWLWLEENQSRVDAVLLSQLD